MKQLEQESLQVTEHDSYEKTIMQENQYLPLIGGILFPRTLTKKTIYKKIYQMIPVTTWDNQKRLKTTKSI